MNHRTTAQFWQRYDRLPDKTQENADKAFSLLRGNPKHPSLRLKKIGGFWSARVDIVHRALAVEDGDDLIWVWIGSHDEYSHIIRQRTRPAT